MAGRIYQRGKTWCVDVVVDGERIRQAVGGSKVEARQRLEELQRTQGAGLRYVPLRDVYQAYIANLRVRARPATVRFACQQQDVLERFFGPTFDANQLTPEKLNEFIATKRESLAVASVNASLRNLKAALNYAVHEAEILDKLPLRVKLLREEKKRPRVLNESQIALLLEAATRPYELMIELAVKTGFRHGEILHLQIRDVDLERELIRLCSKELPNGKRWGMKNYAEREIGIRAPLTEKLFEHIARLANQRPEAWLFPGRSGSPRDSIARQVREAYQRAGIYDPNTKPGMHQLRRTWASMLLSRGIDIYRVKELGGWSSITVVERYLGLADDDKLHDAIEVLYV